MYKRQHDGCAETDAETCPSPAASAADSGAVGGYLPHDLLHDPDAVSYTHLKNLIREFCQEEYDSEPDFSNLSKIGIAYTNATDEEIPIQVNVDLVGYRVAGL